jgi:hypothetical protein
MAIDMDQLNPLLARWTTAELTDDFVGIGVLAQQSGDWRLASIHMSYIVGAPAASPVPGRS